MDYQPQIDIDKIGSETQGIWRFRSAIPVPEKVDYLSLGEGFTPLLKLELWGREIYVKQDHLFPTGSYKDRGSAVMITRIKEIGIKQVVEDSSGNAGASVAAYCAAAGIEAKIVVPSTTSKHKVDQIGIYGAEIDRSTSCRSDAEKKAISLSRESYYASHVRDPFFIQGVKTFAFEIWEQLGMRSPDMLILPVGNGTLLLGAYLGFSELYQSGLISKIPRFIGVQASNCAPLVNAYKKKGAQEHETVIKPTIAEGIAIAQPLRNTQILKVISETEGDLITVSETEIKATHHYLVKMGFSVEPTSAVAIAGLKKYSNSIDPAELIVTSFTGHGLKAI